MRLMFLAASLCLIGQKLAVASVYALICDLLTIFGFPGGKMRQARKAPAQPSAEAETLLPAF